MSALNLDGVTDFSDPSLFTFIDDTRFNDEDPRFGQIRGLVPWEINEPDSSSEEDQDQPCVVILNGRWLDVPCGFQAKFGICKRRCLESSIADDSSIKKEIKVLVFVTASLQVFLLIGLVYALWVHRKKMLQHRQLNKPNAEFIRSLRNKSFTRMDKIEHSDEDEDLKSGL